MKGSDTQQVVYLFDSESKTVRILYYRSDVRRIPQINAIDASDELVTLWHFSVYLACKQDIYFDSVCMSVSNLTEFDWTPSGGDMLELRLYRQMDRSLRL